MRRDYASLKAHYRFSKEDQEFLLQLRPLMESHVDEFLRDFMNLSGILEKRQSFSKMRKLSPGTAVSCVNGIWIYSMALMISAIF